jgi:hypothetical protein
VQWMSVVGKLGCHQPPREARCQMLVGAATLYFAGTANSLLGPLVCSSVVQLQRTSSMPPAATPTTLCIKHVTFVLPWIGSTHVALSVSTIDHTCFCNCDSLGHPHQHMSHRTTIISHEKLTSRTIKQHTVRSNGLISPSTDNTFLLKKCLIWNRKCFACY